MRTQPPKKVYVTVDSDFDPTGYMQPRQITWSDGRVFQIDAIRDFRPLDVLEGTRSGGCYTVLIKGEERLLFFEKTSAIHASRFGRWFVECP